MSKLMEFRNAQKALECKINKLESLKSDPLLKQEIAFESKLLSLMKAYQKSLKDINALLNSPDFSARLKLQTLHAAEPRAAYKPREKTYQNPFTGEILKIKGTSAKLSAWKKQYGTQTVDSWQLI